MTVEQCVHFIEGAAAAWEERLKNEAVLLGGLSVQILSGIGVMLTGKGKPKTLSDLYPDYFGKTQINNQSDNRMSQRQIWYNFLFGKGAK